MSTREYYLLWLAVGLLLTAIASGVITWQFRRRAARVLMAAEMLDALARYTEWVAAQGRVLFFQADLEGTTDGALQELQAVQREWFPELRSEADRLLTLHGRLVSFLLSQRKLRRQDPEAWLESDQDSGYLELWREHCETVQAMEVRLAPAARAAGVAAEWRSAA